MWWERTEREHLTLWQASILAAAMGSTVQVPPLHEARVSFEAMLAEPFKRERVDRVRAARLRALGVA